MHPNSMELMKDFISITLDKLNPDEPLTILDVGAQDYNGTYKELFNRPNWKYTAADIYPGPNVDIVFKSTYDWGDQQYDVVISGQCIEHVEDLKEWALQLKKTVRRGGHACIIAPWGMYEHRCPIDCWRIYPDGMKFLLEKICGFQLLAAYTKYNDCIGFAKRWSE